MNLLNQFNLKEFQEVNNVNSELALSVLDYYWSKNLEIKNCFFGFYMLSKKKHNGISIFDYWETYQQYIESLKVTREIIDDQLENYIQLVSNFKKTQFNQPIENRLLEFKDKYDKTIVNQYKNIMSTLTKLKPLKSIEPESYFKLKLIKGVISNENSVENINLKKVHFSKNFRINLNFHAEFQNYNYLFLQNNLKKSDDVSCYILHGKTKSFGGSGGVDKWILKENKWSKDSEVSKWSLRC